MELSHLKLPDKKKAKVLVATTLAQYTLSPILSQQWLILILMAFSAAVAVAAVAVAAIDHNMQSACMYFRQKTTVFWFNYRVYHNKNLNFILK